MRLIIDLSARDVCVIEVNKAEQAKLEIDADTKSDVRELVRLAKKIQMDNPHAATVAYIMGIPACVVG